jgi:hypothetical protein
MNSGRDVVLQMSNGNFVKLWCGLQIIHEVFVIVEFEQTERGCLVRGIFYHASHMVHR